MQIIKENSKDIGIQIASKYVDKYNKTKFKTIRNLEDNEGEVISNRFIEFYLDEVEDVNPFLKLTSPQNSFIYFKFSNSSFSFSEIGDNSLSAELDNVKNIYNINLNPIDEEGPAYYLVLLIKENSGISLNKLSNPFFLMSQNFNYTIHTSSVSSVNGAFTEESKDLFKFRISNNNNANYYIAVLAKRMYPVSFKVYIPFYTKIINTRNEFINLTTIKNSTNSSIEVVLNETEKQLVVTVYYETPGTLIIQSIVNDSILIQTGYIYYSTQNETSRLIYYLNNFNSFSFDVATQLNN